jgi:hypothetical protein
MIITCPYSEKKVVVYTDGLCFIDAEYKHTLPGIKLLQDPSDYSDYKSKAAMFNLSEGWWWIPPTYRMAVYNYAEIDSNQFLDITTRINIKANNFVHLEEEIRKAPLIAGMQEELYYDISFYTEEGIIEEIKQDLDILDSGNMIFWKNKIQAIDYIYG